MSNQNPPKPVAAKLKFTDAKAHSFASKTLRWELLETKLAPLLEIAHEDNGRLREDRLLPQE